MVQLWEGTKEKKLEYSSALMKEQRLEAPWGEQWEKCLGSP